jgi:DNA-binding response OmpR family regulator
VGRKRPRDRRLLLLHVAGAAAGGRRAARRRDVTATGTQERIMARKVLIADDEQNIVISLEFLLKREGFEVLVAADGDAALQMVAEHHPDLVLLDVMMPKRNGYEVCQRMRERPDWRGIKIIMLSAKGRDVEVSKGVSLGADLYVTKPFSNADLVAQINALLAAT